MTALRADGGAIRATVSGSDGVYAFNDLPLGVWNVTAQASGAPELTVPALAVVAGQATRHDIVMNVVALAAAPAVATAPAGAAASAAPARAASGTRICAAAR